MKIMRHSRALLLFVIICTVFGTGCTSVSNQFTKIVRFIEGEDRVDMEGSTAEVTDLVAEEADVPGISSAPESVDIVDLADGTRQVVELEVGDDTLQDSADNNSTAQGSKPPVTDSKPLILNNEVLDKSKPSLEPELSMVDKEVPEFTNKVVKSSPRPKKTVPAKVLPVSVPKGLLSGRVILSVDIAIDEKGVNQSIVRLIPTFDVPNTGDLDRKNGRKEAKTDVVIDMKDKAYQPKYISAHKEDLVVFTNSDAISHNVFSRSGKNAFDLGTYAGGKKRGVSFKDSGIVKVYCNIHPNMATFVSVVDDGYSMVTDENGYFRFSEIPVGKYLVEAWNIRGSVNSTATVTENNNRIELEIKALDPEFKQHKNKFGESYSDSQTLFKDEFY